MHIYIFKKLVEKTNGKYTTVQNESQYKMLLNNFIEPPQQTDEMIHHQLIKIAFPNLNIYSKLRLCVCH